MFDRLESIVHRFEEVTEELNNPEVTQNVERYRALSREFTELKALTDVYKEYREHRKTIEDATSMLEEENDEEMRQMLKDEIWQAREELPAIEERLKLMLLPKDPNDERNVVLEIRSGAGGDEASLFASDLYRMYYHYAEMRGWKTETLEYNETGAGGASKITCLVSGNGAYSRMKYESGVHRVQRVPKTESQGRIHTSTATVAIMPEAEDVDVKIDMNDVKFDVFRSSGNGGQSVNTTDSAVRLTHIPTGIVISCQDEKSQLKNKDKALKVLRSRLYDLELKRKQEEESSKRREQIGTGDRSEKIRTYNFPQGRVTDHRIGLSLYKIGEIMNGDLDDLIEPLIADDQARRLSQAENNE